jgi:hypothetical protein
MERSTPATTGRETAILTRLRAMANRLNTEGVPTLSGKGRWQKGTVENLLAQERG